MIVSTSLLKVIWEGALAACERSAAQAPTSTVRRNIRHLRLPFSIRLQMACKPLPRQPGDRLKGAWLLEQVRGARDDFQALFDVQVLQGCAVRLDDGKVLSPHDQQGRGFHAPQNGDGQVRPPAA